MWFGKETVLKTENALATRKGTKTDAEAKGERNKSVLSGTLRVAASTDQALAGQYLLCLHVSPGAGTKSWDNNQTAKWHIPPAVWCDIYWSLRGDWF